MAENAIKKYQLMVIGGSAGSLEVILKIFEALPVSIFLTLIVVIHRKSSGDNTLVELLASKTSLDVREVEDKEPLLPNTIYVAPPDYHLLIENKKLFSLDSSEKILYSRPSIDVAFASAAEMFESGVIGVLLSGANSDGARGLCAIKECGGFTIVQDPATAEVSYMPMHAIQMNCADEVVREDELPSYLSRFFP